jgi:group I intron endonuclease
MKTGIYKILNKITGKFYIGYSTNIQARWYSHKSQLRRNLHANKHLQYAWNKYNENSFDFIIVEECSKDKLCEREHFYITLHKLTNRTIGYNIEPGDPKHPVRKPSKTEIAKFVKGNSKLVKCLTCGKEINYPNYCKYHGENCGKKVVHTEETRLKISEKNKGRIVSEKSREKARLSMLGRKYSLEHIQKMKANKIKFKHTEFTKEKMRNNPDRNIKVYQYDLEGLLVGEYESIIEASKITGIAVSTITKHCKEDINFNSGLQYRWSYTKYLNYELALPFRVKMMDKITEKELKKFKTVKEAADYLKVSPGSIYKCLTNENQSTAVGYKWMYI